jgi:putative heme iron utilization protein
VNVPSFAGGNFLSMSTRCQSTSFSFFVRLPFLDDAAAALYLIATKLLTALLAASQRIAHSASLKNNALGATAFAASATVNGETETAPPNGATEDTIRLQVNEKARTVFAVSTSGTLCTKSSHDGIEGAPFGSFVDYVLDDEGCPVLLMNEMSMHTVNVRDDPDGLVTLFAQVGRGSEGQDSSRCSITGRLEKVNDDEAQDIDAIRMRYSITHSYADQVMDSPRFAFYRLNPTRVHFVGGFGVLAKWVPVDEYKEATPDILAKEASDVISRLNRDHSEDLALTAEHLLDSQNVERIRVTAVDRLGIDIRVTKKGPRANKLVTDEFRIGFRIPVVSVEDAKSEILKIFQEAWEKANGFDWGDDEEPGSTIPIMKIAADALG